MKIDWLKITLIGYLIFPLVGCNPVANPNAPTDVTPSTSEMTPMAPALPPQGDSTPMTPVTLPPSDPGLQNLIEKAKTDLAQRLAISINEITLVEAKSVVWPDASLGCPQPGMVYIQVPEDGLLIRLQVGDQIYPYHSGGFRDPFLCEQIYKDPNPPPKIDFFNLTPSKSDPPPNTPDNSIPPGEDK